MNIEETIQTVSEWKEPQSTSGKHQMARKVKTAIDLSQNNKNAHTWLIGCLIYKIRKFGLHNYLTSKSSSLSQFIDDELDIRPSTGLQYSYMWEFYYVKNHLPFNDLLKTDVHKMGRALAYLRDKSKEEVIRIVDMAERGKVARIDFLKEIGQLK